MAEEAEKRSSAAKQAASDTFSLRAVDSADRMAQSLSPWVREMLDGGNAPTAGGSLVHRLLRRRADESVSFLSTLAILRRFHRIATRTSAWKVNVGTISPNLFEKFSEQMFKNWDMGANNIGALLKLNRQEEAIDMPLAGEVGGPAAPQPQRPANPLAGMTMEDIRRRVEEARKFESMSPSAIPNFVKAQDADKPDVRPVGQHPGRATPAPQRPSDQPLARSLPGQTTPTPAPAQPPAEQPAQPSPRMMRRRMARQVEYLSMPGVESSDSGETASGDDSEAAPPPQFDTGPPGLDWFFAEPENSAPDWFAPTSEETILRQTAARSSAAQSSAPQTVRSRPAAGERGGNVARVSVASAGSQTRRRPVVSRRRSRRGAVQKPRQDLGRRLPARPSARDGGRPRPAGIGQRAIERLAASASGQLLASRPHLLLDHIQRQSVAPAQQPRPAAALLPAVSDGSVLDALSFVPQPAPTALLPRRTDEKSGLTPVGLTDFALAYPQRFWQRTAVAQPEQSVATPVQTEQPALRVARAFLPSARPGQTPPADAARQLRADPKIADVGRTVSPTGFSSLSAPPGMTPDLKMRRRIETDGTDAHGFTQRAWGTDFIHPREERRPVARSRALAALQSRPLRTPPTVMRLVSAPPVSAPPLAPDVSDGYTATSQKIDRRGTERRAEALLSPAALPPRTPRLRGEIPPVAEDAGEPLLSSLSPSALPPRTPRLRGEVPSFVEDAGEPLLSSLSPSALPPRPPRLRSEIPPVAEDAGEPLLSSLSPAALLPRTPRLRGEMPSSVVDVAQPPELRHAFEPVSALWRGSLLRSQPLLPAFADAETDEPVNFLPTQPAAQPESLAQFALPPVLGESEPRPRQVARAFLPPLELALARLQRATTAPTPPQAALQPTADSRQQTTDRRQQTADSRPQTADSRQQTADSRPQTADRRLPSIVHRPPQPTLVERVAHRDFAGTKADLLGNGLLDFAATPPVWKDDEKRPIVSRRESAPVPLRAAGVHTPHPTPPQIGEGTVTTSFQSGERTVTTPSQSGKRSVMTSPQSRERSVMTSPQSGERSVMTPSQSGERSVTISPQSGERSVTTPSQSGKRTVMTPPQSGEGTVTTPPPIWGRLGGGEHPLTPSARADPPALATGRGHRGLATPANRRVFAPSARLAPASPAPGNPTVARRQPGVSGETGTLFFCSCVEGSPAAAGNGALCRAPALLRAT